MMNTTNIPSDTEAARLDDLTAYTSIILAHLRGEVLDRALAGEVKRYGRTDAQMRQAALATVHPDDLAAALIARGYTLASVGIASIGLAA